MPLIETTGIFIGKTIAGWFIRKLCDGALRQTKGFVCGTKEKRALQTAVSISFDKFRNQNPVIYEKLFKEKLFRSSFKEEFHRCWNSNQQPDIERLAKKVEKVSLGSKNELLKGLDRLFQILQEEIPKQNDLIVHEQFRLSLGIKKDIEAIRSELGIIDDIDKLDEKARIASKKNLVQFAPGLNIPNKVVELGFKIEKDNLVNEEVLQYLANGYKIILEAEPGAGKSTTLYQISKDLLDKNEEIFPVFLSLPHWLKSKSFLEYISQQDAFSEQRLTIENIRSLARHGHLIFFIDGWNELSGENLEEARINIKNLHIEYPNVGILIATRSTSLSPKLNMSLNITLNRLDGQKRNGIIRNALSDDAADKFISVINSKNSLIEITQIPFYLDILLKVYQKDGFLPETKEELLHKVVHARDDNEVFTEKLYNCHHDYMTALSVEMLKAGATTLENTHARQVISQESKCLKDTGRIETPSQPSEILLLLTNHHLLVYRKDGNQWQFQHQQFQEWYASRHVEDVIINVDKGEATDLKELSDPILNIPLWEEPLLFAVERLSQQEEHRDVLSKVVINALKIDPLLSAKILYIANDIVWSHVKEIVIGYIERWHTEGKVDRALAFMIASNKPEFSDQIWPLIAHEDQQIRLGALSSFHPFRVSCLGEELPKKLKTYSEDIRKDILLEIAYYG